MNRINGFDEKPGVAEGFQKGLPGTPLGVMEGEDQQTVIRQRFVATAPNGRQTFLVISGSLPPRGILDDLLYLGGRLRGKVGIGLRQDQTQPDVKKIGKFGVIDVAGIRGVGDDVVRFIRV